MKKGTHRNKTNEKGHLLNFQNEVKGKLEKDEYYYYLLINLINILTNNFASNKFIYVFQKYSKHEQNSLYHDKNYFKN